jgi:hypothetical protein
MSARVAFTTYNKPMPRTSKKRYTVQDLVHRWGCSDKVIYKWATVGRYGIILRRLPIPQAYFFSLEAIETFEFQVTCRGESVESIESVESVD